MRNWKQVAKLFVIGVKDFRMSPELKSFLSEFPASGVALFNSPFDSPDNIWADREGSLEAIYEFNQKILDQVDFVSVDQEGGRVRRLRGAYIKLPSAKILSESCQSPEELSRAFKIYELAAEQMALSGIRLNYAPVCDMRFSESNNVVGDRSFGERPDVIKKWAALFCDAFRSKGVATTLKHFPGHGPTRYDSHEKIAVIEKSKDDYLREDAQIFFDLMGKADLLMPGHLALADAPDRIFSLSKDLLDEFLKSSKIKLPWITDDLLSMKAVSELKPWLKAFDAGYQFILVCGNLDDAFRAIEETIHHAETKVRLFQDQQSLEKRVLKASEIFKTSFKPTDFTGWRLKILDLESRAQEILNSLGVESNA